MSRRADPHEQASGGATSRLPAPRLPSKPTRPRSRWGLRLGMRELAIGLTIGAVAMAWFAESGRHERDAERIISLMKANASYVRLPGGRLVGRSRWLGPEYFRRVRSVTLPTTCGDSELHSLTRSRGFASMETLILMGGQFTDACVDDIATLPRLRCVEFWATRVSDRALIRLHHERPQLAITGPSFFDVFLASETSNVTQLDLGTPQCTDVGVQKLQYFPYLRTLKLDGARISDAALPHIARLQHLESLDLSGTPVTATALRSLRACARLRDVNLSGMLHDQDAIQAIASLTSIQQLALDGSPLAPHDLAALAAMPNLQTLSIRNSGVSPAGLWRLAAAPKLRTVNLHKNGLSRGTLRDFAAANPQMNVYH